MAASRIPKLDFDVRRTLSKAAGSPKFVVRNNKEIVQKVSPRANRPRISETVANANGSGGFFRSGLHREHDAPPVIILSLSFSRVCEEE